MKLNMTWAELARASQGKLLRGEPEALVDVISTDTRRLPAGAAFWALKGARYDAHDLLSEELARGASGWIVERGRIKAGLSLPRHLVEVPDTLKAIQDLAESHRRRFDIPVVGITGSNGKTTVKEMLAGVCRRSGATCATPGNWNNQLGVPLSVLELTREHRYGVFELADSHPGDIAEVARVARPNLAVLTNIGPDHLEFYGSLEVNFRTKSELVESLPQDGKVILNADDPWLSGLESKLGARAVTFGMSPRARVRFSGNEEMLIDGRKLTVRLKAFGAISRCNAAAAAAAAWALGIDLETIRLGLEAHRPAAMRLELLRHESGCEIVLDAYNANPASMRASIEGFCERYKSEGKVLALGDMKELGSASRRFHFELGEWLGERSLEALYLAGPEMKAAHEALTSGGTGFPVFYAPTPEPWLEGFRREFAPGRAVFLKASRAMRFESLLEGLPCSTI